MFSLDPLHSIEEIDIDQYGFTIRELLPRKLLFHTIFSHTTLLTLSWILLFYVASIIVNESYMEIWPVWLWNFITYGYF